MDGTEGQKRRRFSPEANAARQAKRNATIARRVAEGVRYTNAPKAVYTAHNLTPEQVRGSTRAAKRIARRRSIEVDGRLAQLIDDTRGEFMEAFGVELTDAQILASLLRRAARP